MAIWFAWIFNRNQLESNELAQTLSIYSTYRILDAQQALHILSHEVLIEYDERYFAYKERSNNSTWKHWEQLKLVYDEKTRKNRDEVRTRIGILVTINSLIYDCGWKEDKMLIGWKDWKKGKKDISTKPVKCNRDLLFQIYLRELAWTYIGITPGIYCDKAIQRRFYKHHERANRIEDSEIYKLEQVLVEYYQRELRKEGEDTEVYRTFEERDANGGGGYVIKPDVEQLCA